MPGGAGRSRAPGSACAVSNAARRPEAEPDGRRDWLIVSTVPDRPTARRPSRRAAALEWVAPRALAHETVVEHFLPAPAVLPMQLFTMFTETIAPSNTSCATSGASPPSSSASSVRLNGGSALVESRSGGRRAARARARRHHRQNDRHPNPARLTSRANGTARSGAGPPETGADQANGCTGPSRVRRRPRAAEPPRNRPRQGRGCCSTRHSSCRRAAPMPSAPRSAGTRGRSRTPASRCRSPDRGPRITSSDGFPPANRRHEQATETVAERILETDDTSLLDVVDNALNKGVVLSGDLTLALAQVDLVYARLSVLLCAADRVLPDEPTDFLERHRARRAERPPSLTPAAGLRTLRLCARLEAVRRVARPGHRGGAAAGHTRRAARCHRRPRSRHSHSPPIETCAATPDHVGVVAPHAGAAAGALRHVGARRRGTASDGPRPRSR